MTHGPCGLCGHHHETMASIYVNGMTTWLCHEDDHTCYHLWTIYGLRSLDDPLPEYAQDFLPTETR